MMHLEDFRAATAARFQTQMAADYPTLLIQWENLPFEQPLATIWVSFHVLDGTGFEAEIGTGTKVERYPGVIQVNVHVPEDTGERQGNLIAQSAARVFVRQALSGAGWNARFRAAGVRKFDEKDHCVLVVRVPYERDERNSA